MSMTKSRLKEMAKDLGIVRWNDKTISAMNKSNLADAIEANQGTSPPPTSKKRQSRSRKTPKRVTEEVVVEEDLVETPESEESISVVSSPESPCYGGKTEDEIKGASLDELRALMSEAGLNKGEGSPKNLEDIQGYLCEMERNKRCDPANKVLCDGDLVCDSTISPGVCVSPQFATKRERGGLESIEYKGKKIIGTPATLMQISSQLGIQSPIDVLTDGSIVPTPFSDNQLLEKMYEMDDPELQAFCRSSPRAADLCRNETFWRSRLEIKYGIKQKKEKQSWKQAYIQAYQERRKIKPREQPAIPVMDKSEEDELAAFLKEINQTDNMDIGKIAASQREVFKCLALAP